MRLYDPTLKTLDIKDNFGIKLMVITFNFSNINNPSNEVLLVLLKAKSLLKQSFDGYMSVLFEKVLDQFPMDSDL